METDTSIMKKYLKLSHEFAIKQMIEKMVFELEMYYLMFNNNGNYDIKSFINECRTTEHFDDKEYLDIVNKAIKEYNSKYNGNLSIKNNEICS